MGHLGTVVVFPIIVDLSAQQADSPLFTITFRESKATVAAWSYLNKYIITGHEDGTVSQYDGKVRLLRSGSGLRVTGWKNHGRIEG